MRKISTLILIAFILSFSLFACGNSAATADKVSTIPPNQTETVIAPSDSGSAYLNGLNKVDEFTFQQDNRDVTVRLYTDAELDSTGEPMLDDSQQWTLTASVGGKLYPLVAKEKLQLGSVNFDVFTSNDNTAHVLVTVKTGTSVQIYDCAYRTDKKDFVSKALYQQDNINLMHSK